MNSTQLVIEDKTYTIHIVDNTNYDMYSSMIEQLNICSKEFISNSYEMLSYDALSEPGYVGCFITNNSSVFSSLIIDLHCVDIKNKLTNSSLITNDTVSISLLCSNMTNRIPKLTTTFVRFVINNIIRLYKPSVNQVILYVAKGKDNHQAISFYTKLGFTFIEQNIMALSLSPQGGATNRRKKHRRETIRRKKQRGATKQKKTRRH